MGWFVPAFQPFLGQGLIGTGFQGILDLVKIENKNLGTTGIKERYNILFYPYHS